MGFLPRALFATLSVSVVVLLAGCGGSGSYLTQTESAALDAQINQINQDLNAGSCVQAENAVVSFQNQVSGLSGVNQTLVLMLSQAAGKLSSLTQQDCPTTTATTTNTATTTSTTATTATTQTNTTATTGTSTSTTTTIPTPTGSLTIITTTSNPPSGGVGLSGNMLHRRWHRWAGWGQGLYGQGGQ